MRALICGVNGQDGAFLAAFLLKKGYNVIGTSRDASVSGFGNLHKLGIADQIETLSMAPTDFRSVITAVTHANPDEIYFLCGQSSVGLSFEQPMETLESITLGTLNMLEAVRFLGAKIKMYHASSSECFGDSSAGLTNEETPFHQRYPYAVAKASAHWMVTNYRQSYNLFAANGILFNHESALRPKRFVTQKIAAAAARIAAGSSEKLRLGRLDIVRDWGWAPEYVDAMWRILQHDSADDFVIATGAATSLEAFVDACFTCAGLDWHDHVEVDQTLFRPSDIPWSQGNASHAKERLGWTATTHMSGVAHKMVEACRSASEIQACK